MYEHYQGSWGGVRPAMPSWRGGVRVLIIACVAGYVLQILTRHLITPFFSLVPELMVFRLYIWQLVTHMFMHLGTWHLAINMLVLWMFGTMLEGAWGKGRFLRFYFFCGLVGGVSVTLWAFILGRPDMLIAGASAAIFGCLVAAAMMFPNQLIFVMLIFPMRLRTAAYVFMGIQLLNVLGSGEIGSLGHLMGGLAGYLYMKVDVHHWGRLMRLVPRIRWSKTRRVPRPRGRARVDDGFERELDEILAKIHREGIASLTDREKEILRSAGRRYKGRAS